MRKLNSQDFALLSDHVYGNKGKDGVVRLVYDNEANKEITLNGIKYAVEKIKENPENGYFGAVYRRLDNDERIVVHRGTEFGTRQDREADMRMVRDRTNPQYKDAAALTEFANSIAKQNNVPIYQTGHSLGGALAQLCGHRYGHHTETFNAFGAAGLKEARPLNREALKNIVNHRMGGDYIAAAADHLGQSIFYTTPREVSNLRKGGFATPDTADDKFTANAGFSRNGWSVSSDLYDSHKVSNFTHVGGLSVLSPNSNARRLAQENREVLERFNDHVKEEIRQSPEKFEKYFNLADKYIAENNLRPNLYPEEHYVLNAKASGVGGFPDSVINRSEFSQTAQSRPLTMDDMPEKARELCRQCRELLVEFDKEAGISRSSGEYDAVSRVMGVSSYAAGLPEAQFMHIEENGQINIGYETPGGMRKQTSVHTDQALSTPLEDSIAQTRQAQKDLALAAEQRAREIAEYQAQSYGGRSIG